MTDWEYFQAELKKSEARKQLKECKAAQKTEHISMMMDRQLSLFGLESMSLEWETVLTNRNKMKGGVN